MEPQPFDKLKKIKYDILKRCKAVEEKYGPEKTTSFRWHETKSVILNVAFWKIPERGVITLDDIKTAIYQLEKQGLVQIVDKYNILLTPKGSNLAQEIRTMRFQDVSDALLGVDVIISDDKSQNVVCPSCGKLTEADSTFCKFCGSKIKQEDEFCTYCGSIVDGRSKFCSTCGREV